MRIVAGSAGALGAPSLLHCSSNDAPSSDTLFPQGVASADPTPDAIVLWTRVAPRDPRTPRRVTVELSEASSTAPALVRAELLAEPEDDHTVRVRIEGLRPDTLYRFHFESEGVRSPEGRARTAPAPDADVPVRFVVACCQDRVGRHYHAWRWLAARLAEAGDVPIRFVLFLGDYVYEYESGSDAAKQPPPPGEAPPLPDGLVVAQSDAGPVRAAYTLRDYRVLYRHVRSDPALREVHRLLPFVAVWDDHEFANDCWQQHANDFDGARGDELEPRRRRAATRAFHEYLPVDAPWHPERSFPETLRLYRRLRFGRHVELSVTDQRLYRSDHVVDEGPPLPEVGKLARNSALGARVFVRKDGFDPLEAERNPTMLGVEQLQWLQESVRASEASWRIVGSPLVMAQMTLDLTGFASLPEPLRHRFYFKTDQWDGYRSERARLLAALRAAGPTMVLSGDLHGFYAAELHEDFDAPSPVPAAMELTTAGISSAPVVEQLQRVVESQPLLQRLGLAELIPRFDEVLKASNPHVRYAHSATHGLSIVTVWGPEEVHIEFVQFDEVRAPDPQEPSRRIAFRIRSDPLRLEATS